MKIKSKIAGNTRAAFDVVVYDTEASDQLTECELNCCHNIAKYILVTQMRGAYEIYQQKNICDMHAKHVIKGLTEVI